GRCRRPWRGRWRRGCGSAGESERRGPGRPTRRGGTARLGQSCGRTEMLYRHGLTEIDAAAESSEELSILAAVADELSDATPKLVYADWLEERGDPRGPFLREFLKRAKSSRAKLPSADDFPIPWREAVGVSAIESIRRYR